jgi:hypothetical protein
MSTEKESLAQRQARIAADIARQRGELAEAYRDLAKPLLYTEYGLRGMGFLRQNPWVLTIVPAAFSVTTSAVGLVRAVTGKPEARKFSIFGREAEKEAKRAAKRESRGIGGHMLHWGGRGWKIFKLYRRIRKFLP